MANLLTGDYDAVLQVSEATINRLLASMHQNDWRNPNTPSFPHSVGIRLGDVVEVDGVRGTAWAQVGVPRVTLIDGSTDRFHLEVGLRIRYVPDPGTEPLATYIHGTLGFAREHGTVTSADLLAPGEQAAEIVDWVAPALEHVDYLLPNEEQVLGLTGCGDVIEGCRELLERGVGAVAATCGADGAVVVHGDGEERVPALAAEVVDTTGCGDAFSAGFLRGLSLEQGLRQCALLGSAAAALVAGGLGSDHGDFDLAAAERLATQESITR